MTSPRSFDPIYSIHYEQGTAVIVHCVQGKSRSAAVVLAHLVRERLAPTLADAWDILQKAQPGVMPNASFWVPISQIGQNPSLLPTPYPTLVI